MKKEILMLMCCLLIGATTFGGIIPLCKNGKPIKGNRDKEERPVAYQDGNIVWVFAPQGGYLVTIYDESDRVVYSKYYESASPTATITIPDDYSSPNYRIEIVYKTNIYTGEIPN